MLMTTQDNFVDHKIVKTFGYVKGNTIRTKHLGRDIMAGFKFTTSAVVQGASELLAYGTAVTID